MKCRGCGGKSGVVDSLTAGDLSVWRRRKCRGCGSTWITWETPDGVDDLTRDNVIALLRGAATDLRVVINILESAGRRPR